MPIAATGPSALFEFRSLKSRQSRPAMTVPADATIGSNEPRKRRQVASHRRSWVCSASL